MPDPLEILAEQVEGFAQAARRAIELRLQQVPEAERCDFWALVGTVYARGLADVECVARNTETAAARETPSCSKAQAPGNPYS